MDTNCRKIPAGRFKQQCLALIDEVANTHEPIIITKRNRPVARLVPLEQDESIEKRILTRLRSAGGDILVDMETFLEPTEELGGWKVR